MGPSSPNCSAPIGRLALLPDPGRMRHGAPQRYHATHISARRNQDQRPGRTPFARVVGQRQGDPTMSGVRDLPVSRRRVLGTTLGVGAAAVLSRGSGAAPARRAHPLPVRAQAPLNLTLWDQSPELLEPFKKMMADFTATNP